MKHSTLIHELTLEELNLLFQGLSEKLAELQSKFEPKSPTEYLTRAEVAQLLKCDLSTIHNWSVRGKLIPHGIGNRVYYRRDQVQAAVKPFGKGKGGQDEH